MENLWKVGVAFMVVGLPMLTVLIWSLSDRWFKFRERQLEIQADKTAEKAAQYAAQVERLEQRMRVLERIATDKGAHLAAEIEDLRDDRVN